MQSSETLSETPRESLRNGPFCLLAAGLVAIYLSLAFYRITDLPLLDPDEPRYAAAGRTLSRPGGSLLVPMFNGEIRINKPPLFYWLVALSDTILGQADEISARLPSIVLGLGMLLGTVYLGSTVYGRATGLLGGLVLATTPLFMALARTCITDMTLSTFMAAALGMLMLGMLRIHPPVRSAWLGALFLGLAVLTKAHTALSVVLAMCVERALSLKHSVRPAAAPYIPWLLVAALTFSGLAIHFDGRARKLSVDNKRAAAQKAAVEDADDDTPAVGSNLQRLETLDEVFKYASLALTLGVVAIVIVMARRADRGALNQMPWKLGFTVALAMGLWWYAALAIVLGPQEISALLSKEVGQRLAGSMHREPMYYYLYSFTGMSFPWSIAIALTLGAAWPRAGEPESAPLEQRADRFLLAWVLGIVFFFSIPGAKLATYILGAMPAFALLTARTLQRLAAGDASLPRLGRQVTAAFAILLAAGLVLFGIAEKSMPESLRDITSKCPLPVLPLCAALAVLLGGTWLAALRGHTRVCAASLSVAVLGMILVTFPAGLPDLNQRSTRDLCREIKQPLSDCARVALLGSELESLPYYLDRTVPMARRRNVSENEPFDAVIREEMSRPEKVALCIQRRYFARAIGVKNAEFEKMTIPEIIRSVPEYAQFVATNRDIIVIRNKR